MLRMPLALGRQLGSDLGAVQFPATYMDLDGIQTRTFYTSTITGELTVIEETGEAVWDGISFSIIEI